MDVDAADMVVMALSAGAAAGLKDTATSSVKDAYAGLIGVLRRKVGHDRAEEIIALIEDEDAGIEVGHRKELVAALTAAGVSSDADIVGAARIVLASAGPTGAQTSKYTVDAREARGLQVGENNTMTLRF